MSTSRIFFSLLLAVNMVAVSFLWFGLAEARKYKAAPTTTVALDWGLGSEIALPTK
jgi:hypothetical protein